MIEISKHIQLQSIQLDDHQILYDLMKRIYPPAYINYWKDDGEWYVNDLYNFENVKKELSQTKTGYYFVLLNQKIIGILRIVYEIDTHYKKDIKYVKLHRLYLDQTIQNKGIGYQIMSWVLENSKEQGYEYLWLEVMDKQTQARHFYEKLGFTRIDKVFISFDLVHEEYRGMLKMIKKLN